MDGSQTTTRKRMSSQTRQGKRESSTRKSSSNKASKSRSRKYFHRVARRNKLGNIAEGDDTAEEEEGDESNEFMIPRIRCQHSGPEHQRRINRIKKQVVAELAHAEGDPSSPAAKEIIDRLTAFYDPSTFDPKQFMTPVTMTDTKLEDMWLMISKLELKDCLGKNESGDCMYTLGRMAFGKSATSISTSRFRVVPAYSWPTFLLTGAIGPLDMFRPTKLVCSIQGSFNEIDIVDGTDEEAVKHVPKTLEVDVRDGQIPVRTYK